MNQIGSKQILNYHFLLIEKSERFRRFRNFSLKIILSVFYEVSPDEFTKYSHPFILRPRFLQFLKIWFEKSGSRKVVLQTRISFLVVDPEKRMGLYYKPTLFQVTLSLTHIVRKSRIIRKQNRSAIF